jgi:hypothetical protein
MAHSAEWAIHPLYVRTFHTSFTLIRQDVSVTETSRRRAPLAAGLLCVAVLAAACTAAHPVALKATPAPRGTASHGTDAIRARLRSGPPRVTFARVRTARGSEITIATFRGPVEYVLHDGSQDPGPLGGPVLAGPKITGSSRSRLLAAFNGGFKMASLAGGYEQEGHVARPIRTGLASLVIDRSGQARIGVWGRTVPVPGEAVYSVRQNLWPLVSGGRPTTQSARWWRWGGTIGHAEYTARSALGENAAGDLMYAASMSASPAELATALASHGALIAMELDINPEWVQLDAASKPGGRLRAGIPGQHRPANQYLTGWTRDFIAVQAP